MSTQPLGLSVHLCAALHRFDWWEKAGIHLSPVLWWFQHCRCLGMSLGVLFLDSSICTRGAWCWELVPSFTEFESKGVEDCRSQAGSGLKHEL